MEHPRTLALFDFDGTITSSDTLLAFTRFAVGKKRYLSGMLYLALPLVLNKAKVLSSHRVKETFLTHFFKDWKLIDFEQRCQQFDRDVLPDLIRPQAMAAIRTYVERGDRTIIVSASPENWIIPWATQWGVEVIATKVEVRDGRLTGKIAGKNCNSEEKVSRIRQHLNLSDYQEVFVYGDSSGDAAMLELGTKRHFKPFR